MGEVKLLNITNGVYGYYKKAVKNNLRDKYCTARKKLTRNWLLGIHISEDAKTEWRRYGNLFMCLAKNNNTIIWISNIKGLNYGFKVDLEEKRILERELKI